MSANQAFFPIAPMAPIASMACVLARARACSRAPLASALGVSKAGCYAWLRRAPFVRY